MKKIYTNEPINAGGKRRNPALGTLAVMAAVCALAFGIKLLYDPEPAGLREVAVEIGAIPADSETDEVTDAVEPGV